MGQVIAFPRARNAAAIQWQWPLGLPSIEARQFAALDALAAAMGDADTCRLHLAVCLRALMTGDVEPYAQPGWWIEALESGQLVSAAELIGMTPAWVVSLAARFLSGRIVC